MPQHEFPEGYYATVEGLYDEYEGREFPAFHADRDHFECDWCSAGVSYSSKPRVGHYMVDRIPQPSTPKAKLVNEQRHLTGMATYCEECTTRILLFPCEGYTEVRMLFTIDSDRVMRDPQITDISPEDDGIPWDPTDILERITQVPFDEFHQRTPAEMQWSPENTITWLLASGIDIRELVKWDGTLDSKQLGQARRKFKDFSGKMREGGYERKKFRDHVRGR